MNYVIDTSVMISAIERRAEPAILALRSCGGPTIRSVFVDGELIAGVQQASMAGRPDADVALRQATAAAYRQVSVQPETWLADVVAANFGWLTALCSVTETKLGQTDRWILAEALSQRATVLTADRTMHHLAAEVTERTNLAAPLSEFVRT